MALGDLATQATGTQSPPMPTGDSGGDLTSLASQQGQGSQQQQPSPTALNAMGPVAQLDINAPPSVRAGAAPRPEPYIMSSFAGRRPPKELGTPDYVHRAALAYPGLPAGPYMPQPDEIPMLFNTLAGGMGQWGSPLVAMNAVSMGQHNQAYWDAYNKGMLAKAALAERQLNIAAAQTAMLQAEESREYGDALAAWGPSSDGKYKGDPNKLWDEVWQIAVRRKDDKMQAVMQSGNFGAMEQLLHHRDGMGQDLSKALTVKIKQQELENLIAKGKAEQEKVKTKENQMAPLLAPATPTTKTSGAGEEDIPTDDDDPALEFDPHFFKPDPTGAKAPPANWGKAPGDDDISVSPDTAEPPKTGTEDGGVDDISGDTSQIVPQQQPQQQAQPQPVQVAGGDPTRDITSDVAPPEAGAMFPQQLAEAAAAPEAAPAGGEIRQRRAEGGPMDVTAAPAPATAPVGTSPVTPPDIYSSPEATGESRASGKGYVPKYGVDGAASPALKSAQTVTVTYQGQPRHYDPAAVQRVALQMLNGSVKLQDQLKLYPEDFKAMARARADEISEEMDIIQGRKDLTGTAVYDALDKVNRPFSALLRANVEGRAKTPSSAWANWSYRTRILALGSKVDPSFNEITFPTRAATYKSAAVGNLGAQTLSISTAYRHILELREALLQRPDLVKTILAGNRITSGLVSQADKDAIGNIERKMDTVNNEVAMALAKGKSTVSGVAEERKQINLTWADTDVMRANINAAVDVLKDKLISIEDSFAAGSGSQPSAMLDYFEHAKNLGDEATKKLSPEDLAGRPEAAALARKLLTEGTKPSAPAWVPPNVGEVRRGWRFKGGDPSQRDNWEKVGG